MHLSINKQNKIREVKDQFSRMFPFLKLEFFLHRHGRGETSAMEQKLSDNDSFSERLQAVKEGLFHFSAALPVGEFEQRLQNEHGIPVQVFRKSGNVWLETVQTDHISLEQQNKIGKEAANPIRFNINTLFL